MNQAPQTLLKLLQNGAAKCAGRLGKLSFSTWELDTLSLLPGSRESFAELAPAAGEDHFGTFLSAPGAGFVVIFPPKSGFLIANRFTLAGADPVDALAERESKVLAEVSAIIVNAIAEVLAAAGSQALILSAPQSLRGSQKEIARLAQEKHAAQSKISWTAYARFKTPTFSSHFELLIFLDAKLFGLAQK